MSKPAFYNGILYQIEYQPELSNSDYTQHKVYYIKTEEKNYGKSRKAIVSIMEEELGYEQGYLWSAIEHQIKNAQQPSMANAFHPYYKFTYDEDLDVFVFTLVIPYDDFKYGPY